MNEFKNHYVEAAKEDYKNYSIVSIQQLIGIHQRNGNETDALTLSLAFKDELNTLSRKTSKPPQQNGDDDYVPLKDRNVVSTGVSTAAIGMVFTALSEADQAEARRICDGLKENMVSFPATDVNTELSNLITNYACNKADGKDLPSK